MIPNLSYIEKMSSGDQAFKEKLIGIIQDELPLERALYEEHIRNGSFDQRALIVHKIKHKVSLLGMEKSYELTAEYESNLRNGSLEGKEEFDRILDRMITFIGQL